MTCTSGRSPGHPSSTAQVHHMQGLGWSGPSEFQGKPHLMVGVVLGVGGPLSRLRWLWTGLCAGGMSGLRAGSLSEKRDTALCTGGERGERVSRVPSRPPHKASPRAPPARTSATFPVSKAPWTNSCQKLEPDKDRKPHRDSEQAPRPNDQFRQNSKERERQVKL